MTPTATLTALVRIWLDGEPGAGPPLLDLLEEAGWPWARSYGQLGDDKGQHLILSAAGTTLAHAWRKRGANLASWWLSACTPLCPTGVATISFAPSLMAARAAAEAALRRVLAGG